MKKVFILLSVATTIFACSNHTNAPDVSNIKLTLDVKRFDKDFFSIDTNAINDGITELQMKYPDFLQIFLQHIVGISDEEGVRTYYRLYKPVFDSSQKVYNNFEPVRVKLLEALKYVKYYFPSYETPEVIIPVIGPMNAKEDLARMTNGDYTPDFIGPDFLGVSLQFYLGKDFSLYNTEYFITNVAPLYRSRRFSKEYIAADAIKLVVDDLFPDKSASLPLLEQMVEKGKQWWLLDKFLPDEPDSVKTGYTQHQLNWCAANEGLVWAYMVKNEDFRSNNPVTIQTYLGESPFTNVFSPENSPGNIGQWIGWQIVKKFAETHPDTKPEDLMNTPAAKIIEEGKYKPK